MADSKTKLEKIIKQLSRSGAEWTMDQAEALYSNATLDHDGSLVWLDEQAARAIAPEIFTPPSTDAGKVARAMATEQKMSAPRPAAPAQRDPDGYRAKVAQLRPLPPNASDKAKIARSVEIEKLLREHGFGS